MITNNNIIFTIDDGHPDDMKIADWLEKRGIPAIFYIPAKNSEGKPTLSSNNVRDLAKKFEIGGHTYNHIDLTSISPEKAREEIESGKKYLEDIIGKQVTSFAPPRGHFNRAIVNLSYEAGFTSFRSARLLNYHLSNRSDRVWHPNLHLYPHSFMTDIFSCRRYFDFSSLAIRVMYLNKNHLEQAPILMHSLPSVHFWGHGWEINELNLNLDKIFSYY